jgi:hypothetical protein
MARFMGELDRFPSKRIHLRLINCQERVHQRSLSKKNPPT